MVFSEGEQRVWLVNGRDTVERTYLVSGSLTDNLDPGTYSVYSRSEQAWGIDDSGTMEYFVRFTHGDTAAIGFHDIPVDDGARCRRSPSSAPRCRTAASVRSAPTRSRSGTSPRSARRSSSPPEPTRPKLPKKHAADPPENFVAGQRRVC